MNNSSELIKIGRIFGVQGLKGEVRFFHDSGDRERIAGLKEVQIEPPGGKSTRFIVTAIRYRGKTPVFSLEGVTDRSTAESLVGSDVYAYSDMLAPLATGEYLQSDLIGLNVYESKSLIGVVTGLLDNPAHDILLVKGDEDRGEIMIPLVDVFIRKIDVGAGIIEVNLPEGL